MASSPRKRQRMMDDNSLDPEEIRAKRAGFLSSLSRDVSPPIPVSKKKTSTIITDIPKIIAQPPKLVTGEIPSPITLTRIKGLSAKDNIDTVSLNDILGDPLISEAWIFNFCFDIDWMMQHFDPDVRSMIKVKIIHGSWRREDGNKIGIDNACRKWNDVESLPAYLPDAFGTHHSKMFILFRHDMHAQVIIHTANMLEKDWSNMTQAVWRSPMLPRQNDTSEGLGLQFKKDLMRYLKAYGSKLKDLRENLELYDFKDVRAALVASVPSKFGTNDPDDKVWGHISLQRAVLEISRVSETYNPNTAHLACQVSSIATLPSGWIDQTIMKAAFPGQTSVKFSAKHLAIIYPSPTDVAGSLDGYAGGGSIHTKAQSAAHLKQIDLLRPFLHRWTQGEIQKTYARRDLAAPHIKTYISFANQPTSSNPTPNINWALLTSANLSTQAWGTAPKGHYSIKSKRKAEEPTNDEVVHVQSYEIGVLIWPEMFHDENVRMVPVFGKDKLDQSGNEQNTIIGFRMPYDLPLTPYSAEDMPWSPQSQYTMADRHGRKWPPDATWF